MIVSVISLLLFLSIVIPFGAFFLTGKKTKNFKPALATNIISFFVVLIFSVIFLFSQRTYAETTAVGSDFATSMAYLAAALVTGLCTIGTGIAVGSAASAALGALSENEKIMGKALIFVSLAEGTALYGLLISFTILGRV